MSTIDYLLIGHATADLVDDQRVLGGTVSYSAIVAHAFGHRVGVLTSARPDEGILKGLLPYADLMIKSAEESATYENIYTPEGRIQYLRERASELSYEDIPVGWLSAKYVHLAPLTDEVDPEIAYKFPDATVMITPQGWMRRWDADGRIGFKRWFNEDIIKSVDLVVFSEEDVAHAPELKAEFRAVAKNLVVTNGRNGGNYYHAGEEYHYDALEVDVSDLTGAGDVFAASLFSCLERLDGNIYLASKVAGHLASYSVSRFGLDSAPRPEEIEATIDAILKNHKND